MAIAGNSPRYVWSATATGTTAQLITLSCRRCTALPSAETDLPLVSILRDTLGDDDNENDRVTAVWLLGLNRPTVRQCLLRQNQFFYWRPGRGSENDTAQNNRPSLDLTAPQHSAVTAFGRDLLQWAMLNRAGTPIRASWRAYRTNEVDYERLHLEEAISYLGEAPGGNGPDEPTRQEVRALIARLELRKTPLGGFVRDKAVAHSESA